MHYIKFIDFPVFNIADLYVTISIAVILILLFLKYRDTDFDMILSLKNDTSSLSKVLRQDTGEESDSHDKEDRNDELSTYASIAEPINIDDMFLHEEEEDE